MNSTFPDNLKIANITPVHKKSSKALKDNYRPVSVLPNISKVFESLIHSKIADYFNDILSEHQFGFRKGYSTQDCLIYILENWKLTLDEGKSFGALLTDLSKAFDCISHELLIAKLQAYGFDNNSLAFIFDYFSNRRQRVRVNSSYSDWTQITEGVPQGSILGPLFFNIYICDLLFALQGHNIASYADDTTPFSLGDNITEVKSELELISKKLFAWLSVNQMKGNADKCHLITNKFSSDHILVENSLVPNCKEAKLLGIIFDNNLSFETHVTNLCSKASVKLSALSRIMPYMSIPKRKILVNSFFLSQFG